MITDSIQRIDPNLISSDTSNRSIPIFFIADIGELENHISETEYKYLTAIKFRGFYGECIILPTSDGDIGKVILGVRSKRKCNPKFCFGSQLSSLPVGRYRIKSLPNDINLRELYLGFYFSFYTFDHYKKSDTLSFRSEKPNLCNSPLTSHEKFIYLTESEYIARDLINSPANYLGPSKLEEYAKSFSDFHEARFSSICGEELLKKNLPLIYNVGKASEQEPRLIEINHGKEEAKFSLTLIGKGVCFDTGGLNLKNSVGMQNMKKDMAGSAAVLSLAHYFIRSGTNIKLRILIPCVENSLSGNSFRQGDVLNSRSGTSIEIHNTDAEGRLILADALNLATETPCDLLVSFASLTGSARVAMGSDLTPFFSTSDNLANLVISGGDDWFDPVWRLPLYQDYEDQLESEIADLNNAPSGGLAGSITAALFLMRFTNNHKNFLHFDLFGWNQKNRPGKAYGGLLQGARALAAAVEKIIEEKTY